MNCMISEQRGAWVAALALAVVLVAPAASAAEKLVYKCVDGKGVVSIQSNRCPSGSTEAWARPAPTEPAQTPEQAAEAQAKIQRDEQKVRQLSADLEKKLAEDAAKANTPIAVVGPSNTNPTAPTPQDEPPSPELVAINACQAAQAFASAVREKTWLGITEDQTRRLYGWVADQCKVQTKPSD